MNALDLINKAKEQEKGRNGNTPVSSDTGNGGSGYNIGTLSIIQKAKEQEAYNTEYTLPIYSSFGKKPEEYDSLIADAQKQLDFYKSRNYNPNYNPNDLISDNVPTGYYDKQIREQQAVIDKLKSEKWMSENARNYMQYPSKPDFAEKSQIIDESLGKTTGIQLGDKYFGFGDGTYAYINNLGNRQENDGELESSTTLGLQKYKYMSQQEKDIYNYIYQTEGKKSASEYLDYISYDLDARQSKGRVGEASAFADEKPGLASAASVPANLFSGIGLLDVAAQNIAREVSGNYRPINYNRPAMAASQFTTAVRGTVAGNIANKTGEIEINAEKHPLLARVLNGKSLGDVYQLGMSMVDSASVGVLGKAAGIGAAGTVLLGGSAGTQGVLTAIENGATDEQALAMGILNGTFESLFEYISLDKLIKGDTKNILKAFITQGFIEGTEEFNTTLFNTLADIVVMAEKSDYQRSIDEYIKQGYSQNEAQAETLKDIAIGMGWDFVGGLLSGGIMGSGKTAVVDVANAISENSAGRSIRNDTELYNALIEDAKAQPAGTTANRLANMDRINNRQVYQLYNEMVNTERPAQARSTETAETPVENTAPAGNVVRMHQSTTIDGKAATVEGLTNKHGDLRVLLKTNDGAARVVNINNEAVPEDVREFAQKVSKYGGENAVAMFNAYDGTQDVDRYINAWNTVQNLYGKGTNVTAETVRERSGIARILSDAQLDLALTRGQNMQKAIKAAPMRSGNGSVSFDGATIEGVKYNAVNMDGLTDGQKAAISVVQRLSKAFKINFVFYESTTEQRNGVEYYRGANGAYVNNTIYLDINGGKSTTADKAAILRVAGHELTHFIQQYSPAKYNTLKNYIVDTLINRDGLLGNDFETLVKAKMKSQGLAETAAINEVVADACEMMLENSKAIETIASENPGLARTIRDFLRSFAKRLHDAFAGVEAYHAEAKAMEDHVKELQKLWDDALVSAVRGDEVTEMTGKDGKVVAVADDDGHVQASMRTWREGGREQLQNYLDQRIKDDAITKEEAQDMLDSLDEMYDICEEFAEEYGLFGEWSEAEVKTDPVTGNAIFSVVKANGEYALNLDFSLVCKKRRTLDAVFNDMISQGIMDDFDMVDKSIAAINDIIRDNDFETACALCFVDAKRYRQAMVADSFTRIYNGLVRSMARPGQTIDAFNFGGNSLIKNTGTGIDTLDDSELDFTKINEFMKNPKYAPKPTANGGMSSGSVEYKVAKLLKESKADRKLVSRGDFMSTKGFDALNEQNPRVLSLYNAKKGAGGPKAAQSDVQYLSEILQQRKFNKDAAYSVGGVRIQSFSDYIPRLVFDYVQMIGDLAAKDLPAHAYTKETMFALQFGKTGVKVNMSLVPEVVKDGIAPGLDKNGNYAWRDGQSFGSTVYGGSEAFIRKCFDMIGEKYDGQERLTAQQGFELAKVIQNADGYHENCGTIAVGVSYAHILKMLRDPDIRMVIPYHKSSLNHIVAVMTNIDKYTDYTNEQNTRYANGTKLSKADNSFNYNETLRKLGDAKKAADAYLAWCDENNYIPKFEEFRGEDGYYKLLEDFSCYDRDGNAAPQNGVKAVFPTDGDAFGSMRDMIRDGLEEDALLDKKQTEAVPQIVEQIKTTLPVKEAEWRNKGKKKSGATQYSLRDVVPVEPTSDKWERGLTTSEVQEIYPDLWNVAAEEAGTRNQTQITSTVKTYRKIYDILKADGFTGKILDASSGLGYGTKAGIEEYGFDVEDIEPFPDKSYSPKYTDYSKLDEKYDAIISNAVLNVLPQEQRDALVVKMGDLLNPGGKMYINVRSKAEIQNLQKSVDKKTGKPKNITLSDSEAAETTHGSYQKGFTAVELKAYLEDALGDGYTVKNTNKFGGIAAVVTKSSGKPISKKLDKLTVDVGGKTKTIALSDYDGWIDAIPSISDEDAKRLDSMNEYPYIQVNAKTPDLLRRYGAKNLPMVIRFDALYLAIRKNGVLAGDYHNLGADIMTGLYDSIANADLVLETEKIGKDGTPKKRLMTVSTIPTKTGEMLVSTEINTVRDAGTGYDYYNVVITSFDISRNYLKNLFIKQNAKLKYKNEALAQVNPQLHTWLGIINGIASFDSKIPQNDDGVKYQLSARDSVETRVALADALMTAAETNREKKLVEEYKRKADEVGKINEKLQQTRRELTEARRNNAPKDEITKLQNRAKIYADQVNREDSRLLKIGAMEPVRDVISRVKAEERANATVKRQAAVENARVKGKTAVADARAAEQLKAEARLERQKARDAESKANAVAREQLRTEAAKQKLAEEKQARRDDAKAAREKEAADIKALKEKQAQKDADRRESAGVHKYRARVEDKAKTLYDWIIKNSAKEHVPEPLKNIIGDFLESIDFTSRRALDGGETTQKDARFVSRLQKLNTALHGGDKNVTFDEYDSLPDDVLAKLDVLTNEVVEALVINGGTFTVNDMTSEQLEALDEVLGILTHTIRQMNSLYENGRWRSARELAVSTIEEADSMKERRMPKHTRFKLLNKAMAKAYDTTTGFLSWDNLTPVYAFKRMGTAARSIYNGIINGWSKLAVNAKEVIDFSERAYTAQEAKEWSEDYREVTFSDGRKGKMSVAQIMSLYCLVQREQALGHLTVGGLRIGTTTQYNQTTHFTCTMEDAQNIISKLNARQKAVADRLQQYMQTRGGEWGNEISMLRYGIRQFGELHYFPIDTDNTDRPGVDTNAKKNDLYRLLNIGATKALTPHASNALVVNDIFDVFSEHMADMAKLNALAMPILNTMKWYNYSEKSDTGVTTTVQRSLERVYGKAVNQYVINFVKDLNGVTEGGRGASEGILTKLMGNAKAAAVGMNLRVVFQQPTSYVRAGLLVKAKYLVKGVFSRSQYEEMMKNSGLAVWKIDLGFFDVNIGTGIREQIKHTQSLRQRITEYSTALAGWADKITWTALWNACKLEVADTQRLTGEELIKATAERFNQVIVETQVMDSTITRSQVMRSSSGLVKGYTAFMSEPTLTYNTLLDAYTSFADEASRTNWQTAMKKHGGRILRTLSVFALSALATAMAAAISDAGRDDDEYETWLQKYLEAIPENFKDNINPFGLLPILSDILSSIQGYSNENLATSGIDKVIKAWESIWAVIKKEEDLSYRQIYKLMQGVSSLTALPIAPIMRTMQESYNTAATLWNDTFGYNSQNTLPMWHSSESSDKTQIKNAFNSGHMSEEDAIATLISLGVADSEADAGKIVYGWQNEKAYEPVYEALRGKNAADFKTAKQTMLDYGYDESDINSQVKSKIRELYQGTDTEAKLFDKATTLDMLVKYAGMYKSEAANVLEKWTCKVVTGIDYDDIGESYVSGDITANRAIELMKKYGGVTEIDAKADVLKWNCEKDTGIKYGDLKTAYISGDISQSRAVELRVKYGNDEEAEKNVLEWKCEKDTGIVFGNIKKLYIGGEMTASRAISLEETYGTTDDGEALIVSWEFNDKGYNIKEPTARKYLDIVKPSGITMEDFADAYIYQDKAPADKDANGKTINGSAKAKVIAYIDAMNLTPAQKDTLYLLWYSEKDLKKMPWHN